MWLPFCEIIVTIIFPYAKRNILLKELFVTHFFLKWRKWWLKIHKFKFPFQVSLSSSTCQLKTLSAQIWQAGFH